MFPGQGSRRHRHPGARPAFNFLGHWAWSQAWLDPHQSPERRPVSDSERQLISFTLDTIVLRWGKVCGCSSLRNWTAVSFTEFITEIEQNDLDWSTSTIAWLSYSSSLKPILFTFVSGRQICFSCPTSDVRSNICQYVAVKALTCSLSYQFMIPTEVRFNQCPQLAKILRFPWGGETAAPPVTAVAPRYGR